MVNLLRSGCAAHRASEGETSGWGVVEYPEVPSWEANDAREKEQQQEEARRQRLVRKVARVALAVLGESERESIERETGLASESDLRHWRRRAAYASSWPELTGSVPLSGLRLVSYETLIRHAIDNPLLCWCVVLSFLPSMDEEWDYDRILFGAPWVREAGNVLIGLVDELRRHRRALVTCPSERVAIGLASTINKKRLGALVYGPPGRGTSTCFKETESSPKGQRWST